MNDKINVECTSSGRDNCGLEGVVQGPTAVQAGRRQDAGSLKNSESISVDGEDVSLKRVEKYAASAFPG